MALFGHSVLSLYSTAVLFYSQGTVLSLYTAVGFMGHDPAAQTDRSGYRHDCSDRSSYSGSIIYEEETRSFVLHSTYPDIPCHFLPHVSRVRCQAEHSSPAGHDIPVFHYSSGSVDHMPDSGIAEKRTESTVNVSSKSYSLS